MIRVRYTVGHYDPRSIRCDTDSPAEALKLLAEHLKGSEGTRTPTPSGQHPLHVEFKEDT